MNTDAKIEMKIDNLISMLEKVPDDKVIMVPKETIDDLAELVEESEDEEEEESDDDEDEDSDWDGDLDFTPNCHQCGENCGRSIIPHWKYRKTYFCNEQCQREYDGDDE